MDFLPAAEDRMLADAVRAFADGTLAPAAHASDATAGPAADVRKGLAAMELRGLYLSERGGGLGIGETARVLVLEALASADAGVAWRVLHDGLAARALASQPTAKLARKVAAPAVVAFAHAGDADEPGSLLDAGVGDAHLESAGSWRLTATKLAVPGGRDATAAVVTARTSDGLVAFHLDLGVAGPELHRIPCSDALGLRSAEAAGLVWRDVSVEGGCRLALEPHDLAALFDAARLGTAAIALGTGRAALAEACRYASLRQQFGQAIARFQPIQWMIANSATELAAAAALVQRAAWLVDAGRPAAAAIQMAKVAACEAALRSADRALQVHGGYGYTTEFAVERLLRDATVLQGAWGSPAALKVATARSWAALRP
ncbi:MAG: hypothetical protein EXR79_16515 [Myxococcales bacterium]|nr:hypothetical protein [Myxococcales bacterium]